MGRKIKYLLLAVLVLPLYMETMAQGYLHCSGKEILDPSGENFIIRSIGTGNWMLQEGYMMGTNGVAGTQHEFRERLEQLIGTSRTEEFYNAWLDNHFTKKDLDSMKAWGFNAVRPALHYKWFTPPIEEEPVAGEITWLEKGFALTDSLVEWCTENEMYVIFDMHGAPGGQGEDAAISDYDPTKPSLWESEANKAKLVALWHKIAARYANEPWVGGYDLINETNWTFPGGNNAPMRVLYERITDTIRLVDQNHIIFIGGNWFANDFSGLVPPWDDNMAYSFHKYWSVNTPGALDYGLWVRDQYNVPVWLGETGENSNTWFTNLIALCERENVGWSFWPVKKMGLNNVLRVKTHTPYNRIIDYWRGNGDAPTADEAFDAVMHFAVNHRIDSCIVQRDVIDAMMRQPFTTELQPFREHTIDDHIFASDYALGRNGYAYFDTDTANNSLTTGSYSPWNNGWAYRNDGVDIEISTDSDTTNGFQVGFTAPGEFLVFPITNSSAQLVDVEIRASSGSTGAYVVLEAGGKPISDRIYLPPTGAWENWRTNSAQDILLPDGDFDLKLKFLQGAANLNYLRFTNIREASAAPFTALLAETGEVANEIKLHLNMVADQQDPLVDDFTLRVNSQKVGISKIEMDPTYQKVIIHPAVTLYPEDEIRLSFSGAGVQFEGAPLASFTNKVVNNQLVDFDLLPGKVEAEDFFRNQGFELEDCDDVGGGQNTAYASPNDFLEYILDVPGAGLYQLDLRVALGAGNAQIEISREEEGSYTGAKTVNLAQTGGWQIWKTQPTSVNLPKGKAKLRVKSISGEFNMNWMEFSLISSVSDQSSQSSTIIYPNPAKDFFRVRFPLEEITSKQIQIYNTLGQTKAVLDSTEQTVTIDVQDYPAGIYFLVLKTKENITTHKLQIN